MNVRELLRSAESLTGVDGIAGSVAVAVRKVLNQRPKIDKLLRGSWLGHPVHPLLVTLPIGAYMSALVLDLTSRQRVAARRLVALGLLATPPTAVAGFADYSELNVEQRRVGLLHASGNVLASACFLASYVRRVQGRNAAGTMWSAVGLAALSAGGALGGHLSYSQAAGVHRWDDDGDDDAPARPSDGEVRPGQLTAH